MLSSYRTAARVYHRALHVVVIALTGSAAVAQPPPAPAPTSPPPAPPPGAGAPAAPAPAPAPAEPAFEVSRFLFRYRTEHPSRPPLDQLMSAEVVLAQEGDTFVPWREGLVAVPLKLEDLISPTRARRKYSASAINTIATALVAELNKRGMIGVLVIPDPDQIDPETLEDRRQGADRSLTLDIWAPTIRAVRTLGAGPRWIARAVPGKPGSPSMQTRTNNPAHQRIVAGSPLHEGDLLRKDVLDDYLFRLDRQPGRRVDAAISATDKPGEVYLDYLITENRPWTAYFQLSNTGTKETSEWRERFGFIHNQLTGHDDILTIDFITAGFSESNALIASYELPIGKTERFRIRPYASWSDFTASDVGLAGEKFTGTNWSFGGEALYNVFQRTQSFLDLFAGARWERVSVTNEVVDLKGETEFFIPYIGARFDRASEAAASSAELRLETSVGGVADDDEAEKLGRLDVDTEWTALKWRLDHAFYLEPFLFRGIPEDRKSPRQARLAHEIALSFRGQHAFGGRLIPQEQETVGGLYTVRGYPESVAAGDNVYIFSAEYRFHLPRTFRIEEPTQTLFGAPFRVNPDAPYGKPDWDLIFRGFVDAGRATNSNRQSFEEDRSLVGAGVGVELQVRRNLNLRLDWGFALKKAGDTDSGDNRLHFVGTILY